MSYHNRDYSLIDQALIQLQAAFMTLCGPANYTRPNPADGLEATHLEASETQTSIRYMRVNHTGEICAQALYRSQWLMCRNKRIKAMLENSAIEETDHLGWCHARLESLGGKRSSLNLLWYSQSFLIGLCAGWMGDAWNLGFIEETEKQVEAHLTRHLSKLPIADLKSRAIIMQMKADEIAHGKTAHDLGAASLPKAVTCLMTAQSRLMTSITYWL